MKPNSEEMRVMISAYLVAIETYGDNKMGRDPLPFLPGDRAELWWTFDFFDLSGLLALNHRRGLLCNGWVFVREAMGFPIRENTGDWSLEASRAQRLRRQQS